VRGWLFSASILLTALATAGAHDHERHKRGLDAAPDSAHRLSNPYERDSDAVSAGRKLFLRHCAECHGRDARGLDKAPALLSKRVQGASRGDLFWLLTNGNLGGGMPAWSRLPEARRWQLVSFLKSLGSTQPRPEEREWH